MYITTTSPYDGFFFKLTESSSTMRKRNGRYRRSLCDTCTRAMRGADTKSNRNLESIIDIWPNHHIWNFKLLPVAPVNYVMC